jgi:hypothetical protein
MKGKGRALEVSIRDREFENLLRRASEITSPQRAHPPSPPKVLPLNPRAPRTV